MKCITLHQPYASLIACGTKRCETRSWAPPKSMIGERIAIHAAKRIPHERPPFETGEIVGSLIKAGMYPIKSSLSIPLALRPLPRGVVLCTAVIQGAFKINRVSRKKYAFGEGFGRECMVLTDKWGDYSVGRWVWMLTHVKVLDEPVQVRGQQRIYSVDLDACKGGAS